jgi:hypothetical protein
VFVFGKPSHILCSNKSLLVIGKETKSMAVDDFNISLLSDNRHVEFCSNFSKPDFIIR